MGEPGTFFFGVYNIYAKCTGLLFLPGTSMRPVIVRAQREKRAVVPCTGFPFLTIFAFFSPLFPSFPLFLPLNLFTKKKKDRLLGTYYSRSQSQSAFVMYRVMYRVQKSPVHGVPRGQSQSGISMYRVMYRVQKNGGEEERVIMTRIFPRGLENMVSHAVGKFSEKSHFSWNSETMNKRRSDYGLCVVPTPLSNPNQRQANDCRTMVLEVDLLTNIPERKLFLSSTFEVI